MKLFRKALICVLLTALAACGGGGGSPGGVLSGSGSTTTGNTTTGTTTTGETQVTSAGSMTLDVIGGGGLPTNSISALEIAQVKVTLKDAKGVVIKGAVVIFGESVSSLLTVSPASKSALTDDAGQASVEIRALLTTSTGATVINASADISGVAITAKKAIQISSAPPPTTGPPVSPQDIASAINFSDVNPSDKSIVIQGAGGNGRSESATLRFRVVDKNNTPVKGVVVDFVANPSNNVTLNITTATTDSEGIVVTTVSSKSVATSLVIKATVSGKFISSQSDQLLVTTGIGVQRGFEIGAVTYNLDGGQTGDTTPVTARIVDIFGNPVADGVPVVFTTTGGRIGSSSRGGCSTLNGKCTVDFEVQDPRNDDIALITASTQVGATQTLSGAFRINMSNPNLAFVNAFLTPVTRINLTSCKQSYTGLVANSQGRAAAAGTSVAAKAITTDFGAAVKLGSPILDSLSAGFPPLPVTLEFDATRLGNCIESGFTSVTATASVEMTTPKSKITSAQLVEVTYPAGKVSVVDRTTLEPLTDITLLTCNPETSTVRIATNVPGVIAPTGTVVQVSNSSGAVASVIAGSPVAGSPADVSISIAAPASGASACSNSSAAIPASFVLKFAVTVPGRTPQIQSVAVTYPTLP